MPSRRELDVARPYLVKPSRGELEQFAGHDLDDHELSDFAQSLVKEGRAEHVAVTLGADGAILAGPNGVIRLRLFLRVRSAVGAGDSFVGAIVWALAQGWEMEEAFQLGLAARGRRCRNAGHRTLRAREQVMALHRKAKAQHSA